MKTRKSMVRIFNWLAGSIAIVVALVFPLADFFDTYKITAESIEVETEINSRIISDLINSNPGMWVYEQHRLEEMLKQRPRHGEQETRRIVDLQGKIVAESADQINPPLIIRSYDLKDSRETVGRIEIGRSLRPNIIEAALYALLGLFFAALLFIAVRIIPFRAVIQAERELLESEKILRLILHSAMDGFLMMNMQGRVLDVNESLCEMLGYSATEFETKSIADLEVNETSSDIDVHFQKIKVKGEDRFESQLRRKDGSIIDVEVSVQYQQIYNGRMVSFIRDITERKLVEKSLRESEERYRKLFDLSPEAVFIDIDDKFVFMNQMGAKLFGAECPENMYGRSVFDFIHPDSIKAVQERTRIALDRGETNPWLEEKYLHLDGTTIPVEVISIPFNYHGEKAIQVIARDISERKKIQTDMLKTQKLESLGVLAGGIAHDFNNILTAILGNISLSRIQRHDPEKLAKRLEDAEIASGRARDLTQQLLTFARGGEPVKKFINVASLLKEAAGFAIHGSAVKCDFVLADDLWPVEADYGQISQVIHNLVLNAVQAMPTGGLITVVAQNVNSRQEEKQFVRISITDTGTGISEDLLPKIFDPYFTTKRQGSGLGLASCYSIINKHDGKIRVESIVGKGSTFHISIPASMQVKETELAPRVKLQNGTGHVLVMDDEEMVQETVKFMLEELGYQVECTGNGSAAIELYRKRQEEGIPFTAVLMDLTIPGGMGGKEAITTIIQIDPQVKAVVSSGYSTDPVMANYRDYGFSAVLSKPYRLEELNRVLLELQML